MRTSTAIQAKVRERLRTDEHGWGNVYKGTERELVASGLVRPEWFPGQNDTFKYQQRVIVPDAGEPTLIRSRWKRCEPNEGERIIQIYRQRRAGHFEVWERLPPSQEHARWEEMRQRNCQEQLKKALTAIEEHEKAPRDPEPWDPVAFRDDLLLQIRIGGRFALKPAEGEGRLGSRDVPAHKLSDNDLALLKQKLLEAEAVISHAKIEPINHAASAQKRPTLTLVKH